MGVRGGGGTIGRCYEVMEVPRGHEDFGGWAFHVCDLITMRSMLMRTLVE
jgi:hypothetical protein